jgi:hypothetical protein
MTAKEEEEKKYNLLPHLEVYCRILKLGFLRGQVPKFL